jgi:hypothetical protein
MGLQPVVREIDDNVNRTAAVRQSIASRPDVAMFVQQGASFADALFGSYRFSKQSS